MTPEHIEQTVAGERILVVGVNWIGDTIMALPAVQAFRRAHPAARLTVLVKSGLAPLWSLQGAPDRILTYDNGMGAALRAARAIRAQNFTCAYILPHSFRSALIPFLAGVPERIGLPGHGRDFMLSRVVRPVLGPGREHQAYEYLDLLVPELRAAAVEQPMLSLPRAAEDAARALVSELPRPLLAILPGAARGPAKRWPAEHFAAVAARWIAERKGGVLLLGGRDDAAVCASLAGRLGASARDLAGRTSLPEWAALLKACDLAVANDSGGMHLAAAVGTPVVAVYGLTNPDQTGPLGPACRVIQDPGAHARDIARDSAAAQKRLAAISPERVYEAALQLLPQR